MPLPFTNSAAKTRDQVLAIDLGGRTTKAVSVQRKGENFVLSRFAVLDAPVYDRTPSPEMISEHLKSVCQALEPKTKLVALALGVHDSIARHADLPQIPVGDMRQILKNNPKNYLQQDLQGHLYDCFVIPPRATPKVGEKAKGPPAPANNKCRVLVAGAKKQLVDDLQTAVRATGLVPDHILPGLVGPVNTFERAMPEVFSREVVALVDIGFKNTSICILQEGELALSRVVAIGGDRLTAGLAEAMGISYAEAEGIKIGMPGEVQAQLEPLVAPLGRELRASIDFFEHQQDKAVSQVYISGGSSRCELIVEILHSEMMIECKTWNPISFLEAALPPQQAAEIESVGPQLAVAVGAALTAL
jgi:type IV pilus assembly protein PilM